MRINHVYSALPPHPSCFLWGQAGDKRSAATTMLILADAQLLNQQADDAIQSAEDAKSLCPLAYRDCRQQQLEIKLGGRWRFGSG